MPPDGNRTRPVRLPWQRLHGDGAVDPWRHRAVFERAASVRCPVRGLSDATYDMSTGYGLTIFHIFNNFPLNKIVEAARARESVRKSHSCLPAFARRPHGGPRGGRTERGDTGQDTGSVDPSQAKCELGIRADYLICACMFMTKHAHVFEIGICINPTITLFGAFRAIDTLP